MRLTRVLLTAVAALSLSAAAAQTRGAGGGGEPDEPLPPNPAPTSCPVVTVNCDYAPHPGGAVTFAANISGGDPGVKPTFKWAASGGTIAGGQGTSRVTVEANVPAGSVTATVEVVGYERSCQISSSCTVMPGFPITSRKLDEYGDIPVGDEKLRLDNFVSELQNDPTAQGYLVCYGGRRGRAGEARRRCARAKTYLVSTRGIDAARVVTVAGGSRDALTLELWLVPSGATPPP